MVLTFTLKGKTQTFLAGTIKKEQHVAKKTLSFHFFII